jgi:hypothetical protein
MLSERNLTYRASSRHVWKRPVPHIKASEISLHDDVVWLLSISEYSQRIVAETVRLPPVVTVREHPFVKWREMGVG